MATTIIPFQPSLTSAFQFQAAFDGTTYTVIVTWNVEGQRYYINVYTLQQSLVICAAMVGSPVGYNISLVAPLFTTQLVYRAPSNQFEVID